VSVNSKVRSPLLRLALLISLIGSLVLLSAASAGAGRPQYEPAYFNGGTVTINAIEVPQNPGPLVNAAADFYQVVYPPDTSLWPGAPQCNPCDHQGNGIDLTDFHDHVLDSAPSTPGHGEFNPLWHVFLVLPASFTPAGQAAYAARLPMRSDTAVEDAVEDGVAQLIDTNFYFLCAVVSPNAAR
jgi:hypothetical protein